MLERLYVRIHDRIARQPARALLLTAGAALLASLGLLEARIDMSFRPLFATQGDEVEATRRFEEVFGQPSGAFLGVMIRHPDPLSPSFLARLSRLSGDVETLEDVVEVVSLARIALPDWTDSNRHGVRGIRVVEPRELESGSGAERLQALLDDRPELERALVSRTGDRTLLLARVDLPLADLEGRRRVLRVFEDAVRVHFDEEADARFFGVSVVEDAYARIVLRSLAVSFLLTTLAVLAVLGLLFRRPAAAIIPMVGVSLATPATLGLATFLGQDLTILNSVVPILILVIGVADAIHMMEAFGRQVDRGISKGAAIRGMAREMALPCLLTTLTTVLGFLALRVAHIEAIRDFGLNLALGIGIVYLMNLVTIPALLHLAPARRLERRGARRRGSRWPDQLGTLLSRRPLLVTACAAALVAPSCLGLLRIEANQRFNEEVSAETPVRADQALLEREFQGFLGPEVLIRRRDGRPLTDAETRARIEAFDDAVAEIPGVHVVRSFVSLVPPGVDGEEAARGLARLRSDELLGAGTRELVDRDARSGALHVRTGDLGTRGARLLADEIRKAGAATLGPRFETRVVGQWWLAQQGMETLVKDLTRSLLTSAFLVLPLILLFLGSVRLFVVSLAPNLLPIVLALAFMGWAGIPLRIGTAVVLAVALGIAVDDTLHLLVRLRGAGTQGEETSQARVRRALREAGRPILTTTIVLSAGFASMRFNELLAIRDMGTVGAFTIGVALLADLIVAPALFVLLHPVAIGASTSPGEDDYVEMSISAALPEP